MRSKVDIENLLTDLQTEFDATSDTQHKVYFSKLALLELGGWLEEAFDDMLLAYARGCITNADDLLTVEGFIERMAGFSYKHLRTATVHIVGMANINKVESALDSTGKLPALKSGLGTVWSKRCDAAHTTITGVMPTYDVPSVISANLNILHPLLVDFETELNNI